MSEKKTADELFALFGFLSRLDSQGMYRHKKTGAAYEWIGHAIREEDEQIVTIYRDPFLGLIWTRPSKDFSEKFEQVTAPGKYCLRCNADDPPLAAGCAVLAENAAHEGSPATTD